MYFIHDERHMLLHCETFINDRNMYYQKMTKLDTATGTNKFAVQN
jgi:hypothetical protein